MNKPSRGPGRPPQSKASETHARIIVAARGVFSEVGYAAATFQAIALRADLSRPAINHYFKSKRELYRQVAGDTLDSAFRSGMERARSQQGLVDRVAAFAAGANGSGPSVAAFLITVLHEGHRNADLREEGRRWFDIADRFVTWALDEAIASGEFDGSSPAEVHSMTEALVTMIIGFQFYVGYLGNDTLVRQTMPTDM